MQKNDETKVKNLIGENLARTRNMRGYTQQELSALMNARGCSLNWTGISKIENGTRKAYDYEVLCFSQVLEVSLEELYNT